MFECFDGSAQRDIEFMKNILFVLSALSLATPASAVVIKDTYGAGSGSDPDVFSAAFGASADFMGVAALVNNVGQACTGALISPTAVLTARHCTDGQDASNWGAYFGTQSTGFSLYEVESFTSLAADPDHPNDFMNGTDLTVMTLSSAVTSIEPYEVLSETEYAETVAIVGYGRHGTGSSGDSEPIDWSRRYATNTIEVSEPGYDGNDLLLADFDKEDGTENTLGFLGYDSSATGTLYEGLIGSGDSGGPLFYQRDGEWVVGGIATGTRSYDGDPTDSDYGDIGIWTAIGSDAALALVTDAGGTIYRDTPTPVPLPGTVYALAVALFCLPMMRRRQS